MVAGNPIPVGVAETDLGNGILVMTPFERERTDSAHVRIVGGNDGDRFGNFLDHDFSLTRRLSEVNDLIGNWLDLEESEDLFFKFGGQVDAEGENQLAGAVTILENKGHLIVATITLEESIKL